MKPTSMLIAATVLGAVSLPAVLAQAQPVAAPSFKFEKCFGVAKAGSNDCQTAASSCAGTSKRDMQADAWVYLPAGTCAKIAGGSNEPKKS